MGNVWTILRRDLKRLLRVPAAWVIVGGLIIIPALYAWLNIYGFWNPYGNTADVKIAVANDDEGTDSDLLGKMDLGDQIVDTLKSNHQLGWQFFDNAGAMECVESGECYAAIVIPKDFSSKVANILTSDGDQPALEYYVNEKANAVAPKITDVGATTVDRQVNNTFVSTVSNVISEMVNKASGEATQQTNATIDNVTKKLGEVSTQLESARTTLQNLEKKLDGIPEKTAAARNAMDHVSSAASSASGGLDKAEDLLEKSQGNLNSFTSTTGTALDNASSLLSQATNSANANVSTITGGVSAATGYVSGALTTMKDVNETNAELITELKSIDLSGISASVNTQFQDLVSQLEQKNGETASAIANLTTLNTDVRNTADSTQSFADSFTSATNTTLDSAAKARSSLTSGALPQLNSGLSSLAATSGLLSASVSGSTSLVAQTNAVLTQLDSISSSAGDALESTDKLLGTLLEKIDSVSTDLGALNTASILSSLFGSDGELDTSHIAEFMMSPTVLKTTTLYPIATYGSGMAPLFTSVASWVGVFMLMVIVKLEVDDEGLEGLYVTASQKYTARFLLLAIIASLQALTVTIGDLIIGVQTVNPFMFVLTGWISAMTYLSIEYALSTTFMHVGKGLCVALIIVQIPGASGLYPIEMMPRFFRALYPFFPFTYTISAYRETIGGFYDGQWVKMALVLALFFTLSFIVGIVVRPWLTNLNALFAREIAESDMIVGETPCLPERPYSAAVALQALADQGGFQKQIERRAQHFAKLYPKLLKGALIAGIVVPVALAIVFSVVPDGQKVAALAAWCIWLLLIIAFLMIVEYIRDSLNRQVAMSGLSSDVIVASLYRRSLAAKKAKERRHEARHAAKERHKALKLAKKQAKHAGSGTDGVSGAAQLPPSSDLEDTGQLDGFDELAGFKGTDGSEGSEGSDSPDGKDAA